MSFGAITILPTIALAVFFKAMAEDFAILGVVNVTALLLREESIIDDSADAVFLEKASKFAGLALRTLNESMAGDAFLPVSLFADTSWVLTGVTALNQE